MKQLQAGYVFEVDGSNWLSAANQYLNDNGVVVIRGLVPPADMAALLEKANRILSRPAISGSIGYYMKDPNKKLYDCLLLGKEAISVVTNDNLIDLLESFFGKEVVLGEASLKHDLGNGRSYFPYHSHTGGDLDKIEGEAFSCGMMLYLHDTDVGAFCYSPGTHTWNSPHGADPYQYPKAERDSILSGMARVSGKRGDVVVFDGRGFHGPEQPVLVPRTVLLTAYNPVAFCRNGATKYGGPVLATDLTGLSSRQLRVLGVGLKSATPLDRYHSHNFNRTFGFIIVSRVLSAWFSALAIKERVKDRVRSLLGRKVAYDAGDA